MLEERELRSIWGEGLAEIAKGFQSRVVMWIRNRRRIWGNKKALDGFLRLRAILKLTSEEYPADLNRTAFPSFDDVRGRGLARGGKQGGWLDPANFLICLTLLQSRKSRVFTRQMRKKTFYQ